MWSGASPDAERFPSPEPGSLAPGARHACHTHHESSRWSPRGGCSLHPRMWSGASPDAERFPSPAHGSLAPGARHACLTHHARHESSRWWMLAPPQCRTSPDAERFPSPVACTRGPPRLPHPPRPPRVLAHGPRSGCSLHPRMWSGASPDAERFPSPAHGSLAPGARHACLTHHARHESSRWSPRSGCSLHPRMWSGASPDAERFPSPAHGSLAPGARHACLTHHARHESSRWSPRSGCSLHPRMWSGASPDAERFPSPAHGSLAPGARHACLTHHARHESSRWSPRSGCSLHKVE